MEYEVRLEHFTGPLDLLLHLIQKQEMDVHSISVSAITEQYLAYLRAMEELSLEIASEFVVMAATLLVIKSRTLLPRPAKTETEEQDVDEVSEEWLLQQLMEYQRIKLAAMQLRDLEQTSALVTSRPSMDLRPFRPLSQQPLQGVDVWSLVDAFREVLARLPENQPIAEISGHVVSVDEMMDKLRAKLTLMKSCTFSAVMGFARTRAELVSGFLALLELIKAGEVMATQPYAFAEIELAINQEMSRC